MSSHLSSLELPGPLIQPHMPDVEEGPRDHVAHKDFLVQIWSLKKVWSELKLRFEWESRSAIEEGKENERECQMPIRQANGSREKLGNSFAILMPHSTPMERRHSQCSSNLLLLS